MPLVRSAATLAAAATLAVLPLSGCGYNKPKVAKPGLEKAVATMNQLKSGTEWGMAEQHFLAGDFDKALKSCDRSIALNPEVAKSHVLRGRIMLEKGRLEDARQSLERGAELDPSSTDAHYFLGILSERQGQPDAAAARFLKAADLDPSNAQYVIAAAEMYIAQGELDKAESLVASRARNFDNSAAIRQTQGHILMLRGDAPGAAELFNQALLLAPNDPRILEDLALAQMKAGRYADAEYHLQTLIALDGGAERRDLKLMRARCLVAVDRPVEARTVLQELTSDRAGGRDVRAWIELGQVGAILKDRVSLRNASGRVIALAPEKPEGFILRSMWQRLEGRNAEALAAVDQAIAVEPSDPSSHLLRAVVLQDLGRTDEARAAVAQVQRLDPNNRGAQAMMASLNQTARPQGAAVTGVPTDNR